MENKLDKKFQASKSKSIYRFSGDSKGRVIITDTAKGNISDGGNILAKVTEYTSSGITKYDVTVKGKDENSVSVSNDASNSYTYTPEEGLYYHWTEGTKKTSKYTYYKKTPFYVWGGWPGDDDIKKDLKEHVDPEESPEAGHQGGFQRAGRGHRRL